MMRNKKATLTCYGRTDSASIVQEVYETASKDAGKRARELRRMGFQVATSPMGHQITRVGSVKLTMVHVMYPGSREVPQPSKLVRI